MCCCIDSIKFGEIGQLHPCMKAGDGKEVLSTAHYHCSVDIDGKSCFVVAARRPLKTAEANFLPATASISDSCGYISGVEWVSMAYKEKEPCWCIDALVLEASLRCDVMCTL